MEFTRDQFYVVLAQQLIENGLVQIDEDGHAHLTEKGQQRVEKRLRNVPPGDQILIDIAFCKGHDLSVSLF